MRPWHRLRRTVAPIAVLAVAVFIASSLIGQQVSRISTSTPGPSGLGPTAEATAVGRPSPTDGPKHVFALEIISVEDAIAIRDAGRDDREIAVRGWHWPFVDPRCPFKVDRIPPVQFGCADMLVEITKGSKDGVPDGAIGVLPPSISPSFDQVDAHLLAPISPRACGRRTDCPTSAAKAIVVIGHFDDRRAELCEVSMRAECRDRFVVDRLDSIDGQPVAASVQDQVNGNHVWRAADAVMVDAGDSTGPVLSISVVSGSQNESLSIEPSLMTRSGWSGAEAVWIVRRLVRGELVTHAIVDGTDRVFAIQEDGGLAFLKGTMPTSRDPRWPPPDSIIIAQEVSSRPLVVAVVDITGHMLQASLPAIQVAPLPERRRVSVGRLDDRRLLVRWVGGLCDERMLLTIRGGTGGLPDAILLDGRGGGVCRAAAVTWAIELQFDRDVDQTEIATQYRINP